VAQGKPHSSHHLSLKLPTARALLSVICPWLLGRAAVHVNTSLQGVQLHHPVLSHFSFLLAVYPCNIHAIFFLPFFWFIAPQPTLGEQSTSGTDYLLEGIWYIALIMRTIFFSKPYKYV